MKNLSRKLIDSIRYFKKPFMYVSLVYLFSIVCGVLIFRTSSYRLHPKRLSFLTIFINNASIVGIIIVLGAFTLSLAAYLVIIFNGLYLGNVLISVWNMYGIEPILTGILPHFFFEATAILFAACIGIESRKILYNFRHVDGKKIHIRYSLYMFPVILILLVIAALIESNLTVVL